MSESASIIYNIAHEDVNKFTCSPQESDWRVGSSGLQCCAVQYTVTKVPPKCQWTFTEPQGVTTLNNILLKYYLSIYFPKYWRWAKQELWQLLYMSCEIWSLTLRDVHKLQMVENRVDMQIFWPKDEVNTRYYITRTLWFIRLPTSVERWWNLCYDRPNMWLRWEDNNMLAFRETGCEMWDASN
jgi:hypothetical protein